MRNAFVRLAATACLLIVVPAFGESSAEAWQGCPQSSYSISPSSIVTLPYVRAEGARLEISVTANDGCPWTAVSNSPFITIVSATGPGSGLIVYDVAPNPSLVRGGTITIAGIEFALVQAEQGCISLLTNPALAFEHPHYERMHPIDQAGGTRLVVFYLTRDGCEGVPRSEVPWITVWGGGSGAPGLLAARYTVEPNTTGAPREGAFTIGEVRFPITQSARRPADVNGDGHSDLFWHHRTTGHLAVWLMNRTTLIDGHLLTPDQVTDTNWKVIGSGDFMIDGHPDLVWQHEDGRVSVWLMFEGRLYGGVLLGSQMADPDWRVRAVADFNGDGRPDLFWQHRTTRQMTAWLMYQTDRMYVVPVHPLSLPDATWDVVGAADFDRNGGTDLLWQNQADGRIAVWSMAWFQLEGHQGSGTLLNPGQVSDTNWKIRGVADIDRDGQPDLIWQNQANGLISTWLMAGINLRDGILFSPGQVADTNWVIVGPR